MDIIDASAGIYNVSSVGHLSKYYNPPKTHPSLIHPFSLESGQMKRGLICIFMACCTLNQCNVEVPPRIPFVRCVWVESLIMVTASSASPSPGTAQLIAGAKSAAVPVWRKVKLMNNLHWVETGRKKSELGIGLISLSFRWWWPGGGKSIDNCLDGVQLFASFIFIRL